MEEESDHHQSGALIGSNDDLLTEILIRLPVTSILRFKSVSKHWRLLLTHKHFTHRYDIINYSKPAGLFNENIYLPFDVETRSPPPININNSFDFYFNRSNVRIEQSCNGLLLCSAYHNDAREYYVFNPTTKQLAFIPPVPKAQSCYMALAFHQTERVRYKLVCVCCTERCRSLHQIHVYSSDTRTWKICAESFPVQDLSFRDPVYWKGAVYWTSNCSKKNLVCFKIDAEQLQLIPSEDDDILLMYFGESGGHLHLIPPMNPEENSLIVLEMLTDHSAWSVKYRVQLDKLRDAFPDMVNRLGWSFEVVDVVDVVRGKEEEDTFLVLSIRMMKIRYNVHDKSFKVFFDHYPADYLSRSTFHRFHRYIETLFSF